MNRKMIFVLRRRYRLNKGLFFNIAILKCVFLFKHSTIEREDKE